MSWPDGVFGSRKATKTWKGSRDPDFAAKTAHILALYDQAAAGGLPQSGAGHLWTNSGR